jgi:UDP-galactose transporter B1
VTNSIGPALGLISLKNITYSAQVLVKSCKMVPVMLAGFLLHGTRYSLTEYVCMTLIGVGVALFGSKSSSHVAKKLAKPNTPLGYSLCLINIALDGYTNAAQDHINKKHPKSPPIHMMCYINFWTSIYLSVYLFGFTSQGMSMISFCIKHPEALWDVILFCLCGAFGQLFIFFTIKTFGSLINTLICTTRKFVNILVSVIIHANPLLPMQWVAVTMVFVGLIVSSLSKTKSHHKKKKAE